ncbi:sodium/calcium exchanger 1-like isoform X2 [Hydractinia symbiolongicarpus]|uniref:sodium/calcium exchanger 1-like isoform X2 n=1 Tax=Hydractinia symbiolongicarpus TaxID=13093 RepID=UPI00254BC25C|nr:sodium/calcium exchanger 1-like isoform X2 [Hydractinia symbiolongicarpus]XP_057315193.1 sodium/calcium exchanger 1-like isoform X2 [Hydractinia symbiolongicarpus]XP_057315194.1 sodium/calcium exchanger 1-like isoform X2 [Hydractinia symbiolongicarpus]
MSFKSYFHEVIVVVTIILCVCSSVSSTKNGTCDKVNIRCRNGVILPAWVTPGNAGGTARTAARAFVYLISMFFFFLGISIISDRFMASIEIITSKEKDITIKDHITGKKQLVTIKVWNETVSNLTLMALGSSAPEILLSVIEIIGRGFEAGELGPSTVVGSAAFNLFIITAVCVSVLPPGEVRRIKHLRVFAFTATCSVFAYVWMYIILSVSSPGVIEVWEGIVTLLCFPGMVLVAYLIDVKINFYRYLRKKIRKQKKHGHTVIQTGDGDVLAVVSVKDAKADTEKNHTEFDSLDNKDIELLAYREGDDPEQHMNEKKRIAMEAYHRARSKAPDADATTLQHLVEQENMKLQHKSRAFYRIQATHRMTGQGNILKLKSDKNLEEKKGGPSKEQGLQIELEEINANAKNVETDGTCIYFQPSEYTVVESCGICYLTVVRTGKDVYCTVHVDYETSDGTADAGQDYEQAKGTLTFKPGDKSKKIAIKIIDDDIFELDEYFFCKLTAIRGESTKPSITIAQPDTATITVLDDDYPGVFTLEHEKYEVMETVGVLTVRVVRLIGARGVIRVPYHTEEGSAKGGGEDFEDCIGEVEFGDEETVKSVEVQIVDREEYEKHRVFSVVLGEPKMVRCETAHISNLDSIENDELRKILEAGKPALGDHTRCDVHVVECKEFKKTIDNMLGRANMATFLQSSSWAEQFKEAFQVEAGGDDDDDDDEGDAEPTYSDYVMHYLSLFWKVLFAFIPPTDIWGGWACFWSSICMIGLLTAVTGDIASHFGCTVGLADSVVAISFVALGTSLPDTFASKVATISDETADGSIGNVTGSNSVNVFLGIGLAWSVAAIFHTANGDEFKVASGSLGFSVMIFCIEAVVCIAALMFRRYHRDIGSELGGPSGWRKISSAFFALLWIIYIVLSALETYCHINVNI